MDKKGHVRAGLLLNLFFCGFFAFPVALAVVVARTVLKLPNVCIGEQRDAEQRDAIHPGTLRPISFFLRRKPELLLPHEGGRLQVKSS